MPRDRISKSTRNISLNIVTTQKTQLLFVFQNKASYLIGRGNKKFPPINIKRFGFWISKDFNMLPNPREFWIGLDRSGNSPFLLQFSIQNESSPIQKGFFGLQIIPYSYNRGTILCILPASSVFTNERSVACFIHFIAVFLEIGLPSLPGVNSHIFSASIF